MSETQSQLDLEFWQRLAAAEVSNLKARALQQAFGPSGREVKRFFESTQLLTPAERRRALEATAVLPKGMVAPEILVGDVLPRAFKNGGDAPVLFRMGSNVDWDRPTVAIVGTRGASTYGKAVAFKFAQALASSGALVVSGGALGIDSAAHKGALDAGGPTVAVLAGGLDRQYPASNAGLFRSIQSNGCLLSQFALGERPVRYRFLARNRTIAAIADAVLIVEAPAQSGALVTAHAAGELGRTVYVVPANIEAITFRGSHALIRDGATLVDHPDQILHELGLQPSVATSPLTPDNLTEVQIKILALLTTTPTSAEAIVDSTGLSAAEILVELTNLELDGRILNDGGGYAIRP